MPHQLWPPNGHVASWILAQFPEGYQGWAVDVGASDGISINTTYQLEKAHRWNVLSVDANPDFLASLLARRMFVESCACSSAPGTATFHINDENPEAFSSLKPTRRPDKLAEMSAPMRRIEVPVRTVNELLEKWQFPSLDVLCVDTEGTELDVLKGCDLLKWKPRVVVVECWDESGPIDPYLEARGYKKVARSVDNYCFLKDRPDDATL